MELGDQLWNAVRWHLLAEISLLSEPRPNKNDLSLINKNASNTERPAIVFDGATRWLGKRSSDNHNLRVSPYEDI